MGMTLLVISPYPWTWEGQPGQEDIIMVGEVLYGLCGVCMFVCMFARTCMYIRVYKGVWV